MARKSQEYGLIFTAKDKTAKASKSASQRVAGVAKSWLKNAAAMGAAYLSARAVIGTFKTMVTAAAKQQESVTKLNAALAATGQYSAETSAMLQDQASALQQITTVGDEVTLANMALATSMGVPAEKLGDLSEAIANTTAAGLPAETMLRGLAASLSGNAGAMSRYTPEVRQLTEEQLKQGAAIDLVMDRFGGLAEAQRQTFTGATQAARNAWGDYMEAQGGVITQSESVRAAILTISDVLVGMADNTKTAADAAGDSMNGVVFSFITAAEWVTKFGQIVGATVSVVKVFMHSMELAFQSTSLAASAALGMLQIAFAKLMETIAPKKFSGLMREIKDDVDSRLTELSYRVGETAKALSEDANKFLDLGANMATTTRKFDGFRRQVRDTADALRDAQIPTNQLSDGLGDLGDEAKQTAEELAKLEQIRETTNMIAALEYQVAQFETMSVFNDDDARTLDALNEKLATARDNLAGLNDEMIIVEDQTSGWGDSIDWTTEKLSTAMDAWKEFGSTTTTIGYEVAVSIQDVMGNALTSAFDAMESAIQTQLDQIEGLSEGWKAALGAIIGVLLEVVAAVIAAALAQGIANAVTIAGQSASSAGPAAGVVFGVVLAAVLAGVIASIAAAESAKSDIGAAEGGLIMGPGPKGVDSVNLTAAPGEAVAKADTVDYMFRTLTDIARGNAGGQEPALVNAPQYNSLFPPTEAEAMRLTDRALSHTSRKLAAMRRRS